MNVPVTHHSEPTPSGPATAAPAHPNEEDFDSDDEWYLQALPELLSNTLNIPARLSSWYMVGRRGDRRCHLCGWLKEQLDDLYTSRDRPEPVLMVACLRSRSGRGSGCLTDGAPAGQRESRARPRTKKNITANARLHGLGLARFYCLAAAPQGFTGPNALLHRSFDFRTLRTPIGVGSRGRSCQPFSKAPMG